MKTESTCHMYLSKLTNLNKGAEGSLSAKWSTELHGETIERSTKSLKCNLMQDDR